MNVINDLDKMGQQEVLNNRYMLHFVIELLRVNY